MKTTWVLVLFLKTSLETGKTGIKGVINQKQIRLPVKAWIPWILISQNHVSCYIIHPSGKYFVLATETRFRG
jgi:hypothetical protein